MGMLEDNSLNNWNWIVEYNEKMDYKSTGQMEENWDKSYERCQERKNIR